MSSRVDISDLSGNTLIYTFTVRSQGQLVDLTQWIPEVIFKASASAADNTGKAYTVGSGLTVSGLGTVQLTVPSTDTVSGGAIAAFQWYKLQVTDAPSVFVAAFGTVKLQAV